MCFIIHRYRWMYFIILEWNNFYVAKQKKTRKIISFYLPEMCVCDWACCWSCWWCICNWICCCWWSKSSIECISLRKLLSKLSIRDVISANWFFTMLESSKKKKKAWKSHPCKGLNFIYSRSLALQHDVGACWKTSSSGLMLFKLASLGFSLAPQLQTWLLTALNVTVSRGACSSEILRRYEPFGLPVGVTKRTEWEWEEEKIWKNVCH